LLVNPLNTELNPICHLLALLGPHHILHVSRIRVKHCFFPIGSLFYKHLLLCDPNWMLSCNCKQYPLNIRKFSWHNRCPFLCLHLVLFLACVEWTKRLLGAVCCCMWTDWFCTCFVLFPYLCYSKWRVKIRDILFFKQ
jgi:hypothetical protein